MKLAAHSFRSTRGAFSATIGLYLVGLAIVLAGLTFWCLQTYSFSDRTARGVEMLHEEKVVTNAIAGQLRSLLANEITGTELPLQAITTDSTAPFLSQDPVDTGFEAGSPFAVGFSLHSISSVSAPILYSNEEFTDGATGISPLASFRQIPHELEFRGSLRRRMLLAERADSLASRDFTSKLMVREIPISEFGVVATQHLVSDTGIHCEGTGLFLGDIIRPGLTCSLSISPYDFPDNTLQPGDKAWQNPSLFGCLQGGLGALSNPTAAVPLTQSPASRASILLFDGHNLTSSDPIPPGVYLTAFRGVTRVAIDIGSLPQYNTLIDDGGSNDDSNHLMALHVDCTSPLAKDRGIVIIGSSNTRNLDQISTNGAIQLYGSHTGGPMLIVSGFGGVFFDNYGNSTWNAILAIGNPAPWVTASSNPADKPGHALQIGTLQASLWGEDVLFDSLGINLTNAGAFRASILAADLPRDEFWIEGDGVSVRVGVQTPDGPVYSPTLDHTSGALSVSLSRTCASVRIENSNAVVYWDLPAQRPRIECSTVAWTNSVTGFQVIGSPSGFAFGSRSAGTISLRGLLCSGTITRFGPASLRIIPQGGDYLERIVPRMLIMEQ